MVAIIPGGETGQDSIYNGLVCANKMFGEDSIVLIHDGVRPLITEQTITDNIEIVSRFGNCITCIPSIETFIVKHEDDSLEIPTRKNSLIARAPQSFIMLDILAAHEQARMEGEHNYIDSCNNNNLLKGERYGFITIIHFGNSNFRVY